MLAFVTIVFSLLLSIQAGVIDDHKELQGMNQKNLVVIGDRSYFINPIDEKVNFLGAMSICINQGMAVFSPETLSEVTLVKNYLVENGLDTTTHWTSGREIMIRFHWTGSGQLMRDENWDKDALEPKFPAKAHCIVMKNGDKWASSRCTDLHSVICEQH